MTNVVCVCDDIPETVLHVCETSMCMLLLEVLLLVIFGVVSCVHAVPFSTVSSVKFIIKIMQRKSIECLL